MEKKKKSTRAGFLLLLLKNMPASSFPPAVVKVLLKFLPNYLEVEKAGRPEIVRAAELEAQKAYPSTDEVPLEIA